MATGDDVSARDHDDHVAVRTADQHLPLRGRFRGSALTDELARERASDQKRERR